MKPESRASFLNRSFRRSFKKKKTEEKPVPAIDPSVEEQKALSEFRKAVDDVIEPYYSDVILKRFLKVKNFDLVEAEKLLRLDVSFKKILDLENLGTVKSSEVMKYLSLSRVIGFDKEGALIRVMNLGFCDLKGTVHSLSTVDITKIIIRYMIKDSKTLEEENKKKGRDATQCVYIINLEGLTASQILYKPALDTALLGIRLFQEHFFGVWKNFFVINAPSYFSSVYKLLKPVMHAELSKNVEIYTDNWKEVLLEHIDMDVLPEFLGGSRKNFIDDPNSSSLLRTWTPIPAEFHAQSEDFLDPSDPNVESVTVAPGGFVNISVPSVAAGSTITYHVNSKDNDISVGVFYEPNSTTGNVEKFKKKEDQKDALAKLEQLTPIIRCQSHIRPEIGRILAWKSGTYVINFDNTYSWMNSKQVCYKLEVKPAETKQPIDDSDIVRGTKVLTISSKNGKS